MLDLEEDFIVIDNTESMSLRKVRGAESTAVDFTAGKYLTGLAQHNEVIPLSVCLVRLVSNRDSALVKQIFQRGVALAALDFSVIDTVVEVYKNYDSIDLEDIITRDSNGAEYVIIAKDSSHVTKRVRLACRRNK